MRQFHNPTSAIEPCHIRNRMSGLDDVDFFKLQLVTVLDDDNTASDPSAKWRFQRKRHSSGGFTGAGNEYVLNRREIIRTRAGSEGIVFKVKKFHDSGKWVGGLYTRREYFPGVCA